MKVFFLLIVLFSASCSVIVASEAEALIGSWKSTESRTSGTSTVNVESISVFGADNSYSISVTESGKTVTTTGSYKVGFFAPRHAACIYDNEKKIVTNTLFFRFVTDTNNALNLETSLHSSFVQSTLWTKI